MKACEIKNMNVQAWDAHERFIIHMFFSKDDDILWQYLLALKADISASEMFSASIKQTM